MKKLKILALIKNNYDLWFSIFFNNCYEEYSIKISSLNFQNQNLYGYFTKISFLYQYYIFNIHVYL